MIRSLASALYARAPLWWGGMISIWISKQDIWIKASVYYSGNSVYRYLFITPRIALPYLFYSFSFYHEKPIRRNRIRADIPALPNMCRIQWLIIRETYISRKRAMWNPFSACSWRRLFEHAIHLLEYQALSFRDQEIGVGEAECAQWAPEEENLWAEVDTTAGGGCDVRGDNCDDLFYPR
jgi:hypothetical protein